MHWPRLLSLFPSAVSISKGDDDRKHYQRLISIGMTLRFLAIIVDIEVDSAYGKEISVLPSKPHVLKDT